MIDAGKTILLVEQNVRFGLRLATHGHRDGERPGAARRAARDDVLNNPEMADLYFGGSVKQAGQATRRPRRDGGAVGGRLRHRVRALPERQPARRSADIEDAYVSTFLQLAMAAAVLVVRVLATEDLEPAGRRRRLRRCAAFAAAGIVHFLLGWTFLNLSQTRIGAARTAPLLTLTPVFGAGGRRGYASASSRARRRWRRSRRWSAAPGSWRPRAGRVARRADALFGSRLRADVGAQPGAHGARGWRGSTRRCSA